MNAQPDSREFEYWPIVPLFRRETVFCLASGPSLTAEICEKVRDRRRIVVNSTCMLAPDADALFFTDSSWYEQRREIVRDFPGEVMSMSRTAKREMPDKVKRVKGEGDPAFPPDFRRPGGVIQQGRSSGHTAVSLAIALGASRVVLLGYDMRVVGGREHHHTEYAGERDLDQYQREFVPAFAGWNAAACAAGVEVLNATEGSAVREFPTIAFDEALAG